MAIVILIVVVALFAALFLIRVSHGHAQAISSVEELSSRTQPVDIAAFRNLLNPAETLYLKRNLPPADFRSIHRERLQAAAEYVSRIALNAAVLIRLGQASRTNPDPEIAGAARSIVDRALAVRLMAMQALIKLRLQAAFPDLNLSTSDLFDRYRSLTDSVVLLTRLQRPTSSTHILAHL